MAGLRISSKGQRITTLAFDVTKQDGSTVQDGETTLLVRSRNGD